MCDSAGRDNIMVLCDQCNKGFHTTCFELPMESIPKGPWSCEECTESRHTKSIDTPVAKKGLGLGLKATVTPMTVTSSCTRLQENQFQT